MFEFANKIRAYPEGFLNETTGASFRQMLRRALNSTNLRYKS